MSTNKLSHLKEWDKIYLEVEKVTTQYDDEKSMCFNSNFANSIWVNDDDIFYFPDELKQLANDGMPKQGDDVQIKYIEDEWKRGDWIDAKFIAFYEWKIVVDIGWLIWTTIWKLKPQKTELTLAEVEERLGLDAWSLIIK